MRAVPLGWKMVAPWLRQNSSKAASSLVPGPGLNSRFTYGRIAGAAAMARAALTPATVVRRSSSVAR